MNKGVSCVIYSCLILFGSSAYADYRDPTLPLGNKGKAGVFIENKLKKKSNNLILSSIFIGNNKKIVLINGKEYKENDFVMEYQIKKITFDKVRLTSSDSERWLTINTVNEIGFTLK